MSLHERTDDEIKHKLSSGELGDKKTAMAEAVLRYRRNERGCRIGFKDTHHGAGILLPRDGGIDRPIGAAS